MVRRRSVPRRGGISGHRGPPSHSSPQNITPLASASPSSPPLEHSRPSLNSSFQTTRTTRFKFRSKLNKPLISASITIILMEEEDVPSSSDTNSTSHSQSQSQHYSGLQGEIAGIVLSEKDMQNEEAVPDAAQPQPTSSQDQTLACEPMHFTGGILNLTIPPDGGLPEGEDNEMVTWIGSPSQVNKDATDSQTHD